MDTTRSSSYLDLHIDIDSEGRLRTKLYDIIIHFKSPIVNFPFICNIILTTPVYAVNITQLIQGFLFLVQPDILDRGGLLTMKLPKRLC
jgi:hypothetical protein